jgi:hypothetical protein
LGISQQELLDTYDVLSFWNICVIEYWNFDNLS